MVVDITNAFLNTISALFGGIADGIVNLFHNLIYPEIIEAGTDGILGTADDVMTGTYELSSLGTWMIIFMGFSFAITIFYALFRKVA